MKAIQLERNLDSIELTDTGRFIWLVTVTASISGALFSYDTGIISAVLVYLGTDLNDTVMSSSQRKQSPLYVQVVHSLVPQSLVLQPTNMAARLESTLAAYSSPSVPFSKQRHFRLYKCALVA